MKLREYLDLIVNKLRKLDHILNIIEQINTTLGKVPFGYEFEECSKCGIVMYNENCPKCGFVNVRNSKVCYNCSYRLDWELKENNTPHIIKKCSKCGFINSGHTKICYNCNNKMVEN